MPAVLKISRSAIFLEPWICRTAKLPPSPPPSSPRQREGA